MSVESVNESEIWIMNDLFHGENISRGDELFEKCKNFQTVIQNESRMVYDECCGGCERQ